MTRNRSFSVSGPLPFLGDNPPQIWTDIEFILSAKSVFLRLSLAYGNGLKIFSGKFLFYAVTAPHAFFVVLVVPIALSASI